MYDIGSWVIEKKNYKKVKIIEIDELWNYKLYTVYDPEEGKIYKIDEDNLRPLDTEESINIYELRYLLLAAKIKNATSTGILSSVGDSIIPLPHQLYALNRALSDNDIRYLLADEVGLGKTIEAGLIIKELKLRGLIKKILIVSPKSLMVQWRDEMKSKFDEEFKIILPEDFNTLKRLYGKKIYGLILIK